MIEMTILFILTYERMGKRVQIITSLVFLWYFKKCINYYFVWYAKSVTILFKLKDASLCYI
jgi:hypothetical protein